jgi:hypothetical protein
MIAHTCPIGNKSGERADRKVTWAPSRNPLVIVAVNEYCLAEIWGYASHLKNTGDEFQVMSLPKPELSEDNKSFNIKLKNLNFVSSEITPPWPAFSYKHYCMKTRID